MNSRAITLGCGAMLFSPVLYQTLLVELLVRTEPSFRRTPYSNFFPLNSKESSEHSVQHSP